MTKKGNVQFQTRERRRSISDTDGSIMGSTRSRSSGAKSPARNGTIHRHERPGYDRTDTTASGWATENEDEKVRLHDHPTLVAVQYRMPEGYTNNRSAVRRATSAIRLREEETDLHHPRHLDRHHDRSRTWRIACRAHLHAHDLHGNPNHQLQGSYCHLERS